MASQNSSIVISNIYKSRKIVLELMNIPTDPQTLAFECKDHAGESLEDTMGNSIQPEITPAAGSPLANALEGPKMPVPNAPKLGGTRYRKMKNRKTRKRH
jgi:hypothetical protein